MLLGTLLTVCLPQVDRERSTLRVSGFGVAEDQVALGDGKLSSLYIERPLLQGLQGEISKILS